MLATAQRVIASERITLDPKFFIINRLPCVRRLETTVFSHKRVEYDGLAELVGNSPALLRICIVQPRLGGEWEFGNLPRAEDVFGRHDPWNPITIATAIDKDQWIGVSDRHYLVTAEPVADGHSGIWLDYSHRLSNNLSMQEPTLGASNIVSIGPMFLCAFSDTDTSDSHVRLRNVTARTIGHVSYIDDPQQWGDF